MTDSYARIIEEIPRLRRFARALAGPAAADDLVQDCLARALERLHLWREGTSMRAWLFTILTNLHANQCRDRARRPGETSLDALAGASLSDAPRQGGRIVLRDVARALDRLPQEQRAIILLIALEGMSYKETADILGVPVGTVMSRLSRGREALRRLMDRPAQNGGPSLRRVK